MNTIPQDIKDHIATILDNEHSHSGSFCHDIYDIEKQSDDELASPECLFYNRVMHKLAGDCNPDDLDCYCNWTPLEQSRGSHTIPDERLPAFYEHTCTGCQSSFMDRWEREECDECQVKFQQMAAAFLIAKIDRNPNFLRDEFGL